MAFFSVKEFECVNPDFSPTSRNMCESFCDDGDCILNRFLECSYSSLETPPNKVHSLESSDPWDKSIFETSETLGDICSKDDKVNASGNFFNEFSVDFLSEEIYYAVNDFPSCEMALYDGFESFATNASTVDVLDYLEESDLIINKAEKSNTFCKQDLFISRGEYFGEIGNTTQPIVASFCSDSDANNSLLTSCTSWSTNIQADLIPCTATQNNALQEPCVLENKTNGDITETSVGYNTKCDTLIQQNNSLYCKTRSTASIVQSTVHDHSLEKETVPSHNSSSLQTSADNEHEIRRNQITEESSPVLSCSTPILNVPFLKVKNVNPMDQRKDTKSELSKHWQVPSFSKIGKDWQILSNKNVKITVPVPSIQPSGGAITKYFLGQKTTITGASQTKSMKDTITKPLEKTTSTNLNNLLFFGVKKDRLIDRATVSNGPMIDIDKTPRNNGLCDSIDRKSKNHMPNNNIDRSFTVNGAKNIIDRTAKNNRPNNNIDITFMTDGTNNNICRTAKNRPNNSIDRTFMIDGANNNIDRTAKNNRPNDNIDRITKSNTPNNIKRIAKIKTNDNIDRTPNKILTYTKVGKKGKFVTLPSEKVKKLMVRELLSMSGNKKELSMKEKTHEYRKNIHQMMEQKRKRLSLT